MLARAGSVAIHPSIQTDRWQCSCRSRWAVQEVPCTHIEVGHFRKEAWASGLPDRWYSYRSWASGQTWQTCRQSQLSHFSMRPEPPCVRVFLLPFCLQVLCVRANIALLAPSADFWSGPSSPPPNILPKNPATLPATFAMPASTLRKVSDFSYRSWNPLIANPIGPNRNGQKILRASHIFQTICRKVSEFL